MHQSWMCLKVHLEPNMFFLSEHQKGWTKKFTPQTSGPALCYLPHSGFCFLCLQGSGKNHNYIEYLLYALFFILLFKVFVVQIVLDCSSPWAQDYRNHYEPYLKDPSAYPKVQVCLPSLSLLQHLQTNLWSIYLCSSDAGEHVVLSTILRRCPLWTDGAGMWMDARPDTCALRSTGTGTFLHLPGDDQTNN